MIRPYADDDLETLLGVWYAASQLGHPFLNTEFLEQERRNIVEVYIPNAETWIFEEEGRLIGFISLLGDEVGGIFVDPDQHGRGVGSALIKHARGLCGSLEVEVFEKNALGRRFYEARGFQLLGEEIHAATGEAVLRLRLSS